jgi:hypothetical protein
MVLAGPVSPPATLQVSITLPAPATRPENYLMVFTINVTYTTGDGPKTAKQVQLKDVLPDALVPEATVILNNADASEWHSHSACKMNLQLCSAVLFATALHCAQCACGAAEALLRCRALGTDSCTILHV